MIEESSVEPYRAEEPLKPAMVRPEVATVRGIEPGALVQRVLFESNTYLPDISTYRIGLSRSRKAIAPIVES